MSYVVMSWLGSYGRLGNQMFQYALMVGIAKRTGLQIQVNNDGSDVSKIFDIERNNAVAPISRWFTEKGATEFTPDVEHLKYAGGNLGISRGYFQSEKYFIHAREEVCSAFKFRDTTTLPNAKSHVDSIRIELPVVAIHVRRGDYLALPDYHPFDAGYYKRAIKTIYESLGRCSFIVVSDEIEWCRMFFGKSEFADFGTFAFNCGSPSQDLGVMQQADHVIIANSSFSWWGAWLNRSVSKVVIAPSMWFGPRGPKKWSDVYAKGWVTV